MIAIAKIGGHQALLSVGEKIEVDKLNAKPGSTIQFETLLIANPDGSNFEIGTPIIKNIFVEAKVLEHVRGEKVRVFKMKPRKRYRRKIGHRQEYTIIEITKIGDHTTPLAKPEKKEPVSKTKSVRKEKVSKIPKKEENKTEPEKVTTKKSSSKK